MLTSQVYSEGLVDMRHPKTRNGAYLFHMSQWSQLLKRELKRWGRANILGWFKEHAFWGSPRRVSKGPLRQTGTHGYVLDTGSGGYATLVESKSSRFTST